MEDVEVDLDSSISIAQELAAMRAEVAALRSQVGVHAAKIATIDEVNAQLLDLLVGFSTGVLRARALLLDDTVLALDDSATAAR